MTVWKMWLIHLLHFQNPNFSFFENLPKMYKDNKKWQTKARYENSTLCFKSGKPASLKLSLTVTYFANFFSKICFVNFYNIQKISSRINLQILRIRWHCFKSFIVISWSTWIFKLTSKYWPSINQLPFLKRALRKNVRLFNLISFALLCEFCILHINVTYLWKLSIL